MTTKLNELPNRNMVWAFEVDGQFVRWCGTLEQFEKDVEDYVDTCKGQFNRHSKYHVSFYDAEMRDTTHFRAIKN